MVVNGNSINEDNLNKVSGGYILQGFVKRNNTEGFNEPIFTTYYKVVSDDYFNDDKPKEHIMYAMTKNLDSALKTAEDNNFSTSVIDTCAIFADAYDPKKYHR